MKYPTGRLILRNRNQVTLPKDMLQEGVREYEYERLPDGSFHVTPLLTVPANQQYFWTKRWQAGERQADEDAQHGRFKDYNDVEDLIRDLRTARAKKVKRK